MAMISVTERTATIGRIRNLARKVASWLANGCSWFPALERGNLELRLMVSCVDVVLLMPLPSSWCA